jgi:hypothetical protein
MISAEEARPKDLKKIFFVLLHEKKQSPMIFVQNATNQKISAP